MRPLRISIQGLRSFRAEVDIDFGDRTQIAVIGDTGAGKSSILEAMTYALYGQTSLGGRSKQELMNDTSDTMRVVLRFRVSGEEWEVARVDRRTGAGGLAPARAQLVGYGDDGDAIEKVEGVKPVNNRVQELLGLDSDAFLRTVILPQGRFARLLVEDGPKHRADILRQVWPTDDLERAGAFAAQRLAEVRVLAARLQGAVEGYPDDPEEHLALLKRWAGRMEREAEALAQLRDRAVEALGNQAAAEETIAGAGAVRATVTPHAVGDLLARLAPVEGEQRRIHAERAELEHRAATLRRDLDSIPTDDGPDLRAVGQALAVLNALPEQGERAVADADALRASMVEEGVATGRLVEARRVFDAAEETLARHRALEPPLAAAVQSADQRWRKTERSYEECEDLQRRILATGDDLMDHRQETDQLEVDLADAGEAEGRAVRVVEKAQAHLDEAQRNDAAAAAAHGLHEGDDCPVCARELPEGWTPPRDEGVGAAKDALSEARLQADRASRAAAALRAQHESAQRRSADIEKALERLNSEMAEALTRLRTAAGVDGIEWPDLPPTGSEGTVEEGTHGTVRFGGDWQLPARELVIGPAMHEHRTALEAMDAHGAEAAALGSAHTDAVVARDAAQQALKHVRETIDRSRTSAAESLRGLGRSVQSIAPSFRPQLRLPTDPADLASFDRTPVDRAAYAAREREEILELRQAKRLRLRQQMDEARGALKRLDVDGRTKVEGPLQEIVRLHSDQRTTLADAVRPLDARITIPDQLHYPVGPDALRHGIEQLRTAMQRGLETADRLRSDATSALDQARATARDIVEQLGRLAEHSATVDAPAPPAPGAADLQAVVIHVTNVANDAGYAARQAAQQRDAFAAILDDVLELRQTAAEAAALELALGDLDAALKPGAFLKWLTLRRSRDLLVHASKMLEQMTAGRYAFADPGDSDNPQWLVVDIDSGQARSPASLSGGEQFLGSLALALGMVEMMARSGGRLESLFLDEGFGTLDRNNLDSAVEALSVVSGTGQRMVGVISHVAAVAEQIEDVLAVTRSVSGSQAKWLSGAERQDLGGSDAGAGLLD